MKTHRRYALPLTLALLGCGAGVNPHSGPERPAADTGLNHTLRLDTPVAQLPGPGLCRLQGAPADDACHILMNRAGLGAVVLYRPADAREIHVRYLDEGQRGEIYRVDIFDLDTRKLIREVN